MRELWFLLRWCCHVVHCPRHRFRIEESRWASDRDDLDWSAVQHEHVALYVGRCASCGAILNVHLRVEGRTAREWPAPWRVRRG